MCIAHGESGKWNINFEIININVARQLDIVIIKSWNIYFVHVFDSHIYIYCSRISYWFWIIWNSVAVLKTHIMSVRSTYVGARGDDEGFMFDVRVVYFIDIHVAVLMASMCIVCSLLYLFTAFTWAQFALNAKLFYPAARVGGVHGVEVDEWMWYAVTAEWAIKRNKLHNIFVHVWNQFETLTARR